MTAGTRGRTVIVNFPGSKKASAECFGFVEAALPHAVDLMRGAGEKVDRTHRELQHGKVGTCIYVLTLRHTVPWSCEGSNSLDVS